MVENGAKGGCVNLYLPARLAVRWLSLSGSQDRANPARPKREQFFLARGDWLFAGWDVVARSRNRMRAGAFCSMRAYVKLSSPSLAFSSQR